MTNLTTVRFVFDRINNPSMKEKIISNPDSALLTLKIGSVVEVYFEKDAYFADFKISDKLTNVVGINEGTDINEIVYTLQYIPRSTRTKTEYEKSKPSPI